MTAEQLDEIEKDALETDWQPDFRDVLKLVKALREARAAATRQTERLMQSEELTDLLHKERDEARAEVERLRAALGVTP